MQYKEYEQVVVEDRIDKEKTRRKQEQEAIELKASIKVSILWFNSCNNSQEQEAIELKASIKVSIQWSNSCNHSDIETRARGYRAEGLH